MKFPKRETMGSWAGRNHGQNRGDPKTLNGGKLPQILKGGMAMIANHITMNYEKIV